MELSILKWLGIIGIVVFLYWLSFFVFICVVCFVMLWFFYNEAKKAQAYDKWKAENS